MRFIGSVASLLMLAACASRSLPAADISSCAPITSELRTLEHPHVIPSKFYLCTQDVAAALDVARPAATETVALISDTDRVPPDLSSAVRVHVAPQSITYRGCGRVEDAACRASGWANMLELSAFWTARSGKTFNYAELAIHLEPMTQAAWEDYISHDFAAFAGNEGRAAADGPPNGPAGLYVYISGTTSSHAIGAEWCNSSYDTYFQETAENGHVQINAVNTTCSRQQEGRTLVFLHGGRLLVSVDMTDVPVESWREVLAVTDAYVESALVR